MSIQTVQGYYLGGLRVREATELLATARTLTPGQRQALTNAERAPFSVYDVRTRVTEAMDAVDDRWRTHIWPIVGAGMSMHGQAVLLDAMAATLAGDLISPSDRAALLAPWETVMGS